MLTIHMIISHSFLPIKTFSFVTIDRIRTGKLDVFDLITGERHFNRDSRSIYPSDNYALEDVSGIMYDFQNDILYTGT